MRQKNFEEKRIFLKANTRMLCLIIRALYKLDAASVRATPESCDIGLSPAVKAAFSFEGVLLTASLPTHLVRDTKGLRCACEQGFILVHVFHSLH